MEKERKKKGTVKKKKWKSKRKRKREKNDENLYIYFFPSFFNIFDKIEKYDERMTFLVRDIGAIKL